jgi:hypothetical protein
MKTDITHKNGKKLTVQKFKVNAENTKKYKENMRRTVESRFWKQSNENREEDLDERLYKRIIKDTHTENPIEEFSEAMRIACEQSFRTTTAARKSQKHKSVPSWWTQEIEQ